MRRIKLLLALLLALTGYLLATPLYTTDQVLYLWGNSGFSANLQGSPPTVNGYLTGQQILNLWAQAGFPITLSGNVPPAQLGGGTPAANKYVDGGTGNWTALPSSSTNASLLTSGLVSLNVGGTAANLTGAGVSHGYLSLGSGATAVSVAQPSYGDLAGNGSSSITTIGTLSAGTVPLSLTSGVLPLSQGGAGVSLASTGGAGQVLKQTSSGANVTVAALVAGDIPNLAASKLTSGQVALAQGGTNANLSATGGAHQYLQQSSSGANITVGQPSFSDISGLGTAATNATGDFSPAAGSSSITTVGTISAGAVPASLVTGTLNTTQIGTGSPTAGYYVDGGTGAWTVLPGGGGASFGWMYGSGFDGDLSVSSGTTTLARDTYYNNLTISGTAQLYTHGYRLFVSNTLDLSNAPANAISVDAVSLNGGNGAAATTAGTAGKGVSSGTGTNLGTLNANIDGAAGGSSTTTNGNNGASSTQYTGKSHMAANTPGVSGAGGAGNTTSGGIGGPASLASNYQPLPPYVTEFFTKVTISSGLVTVQLQGAGAGGNGGGGGGGSTALAGGGGGGGGGGGPIMAIYANKIVRGSSTVAPAIVSVAGNGGNGGSASNSNCGGGGGGNGGGGGFIYLVYSTLSGTSVSGFLRANGGNGGNGGNGNGNGLGGSGGTGYDGGQIEVINPDTAGLIFTTGSAGSAGATTSNITGGTGGAGGTCTVTL